MRHVVNLRDQGTSLDDIVKQAMAKWPDVPHCYGWLGLDARGNWYMRDDATQAAGPFAQSKGSLLQHDKLIDFIGRNYASDEQGRWYFQNGPQRVFVELESTPYIARITPEGRAEVFVTLPPGSTGNGIRFDRDGMMFVADYTGHNVLRIDPRTRSVSVFAHDDRMNQPNDLAIAPDGTLYASDPNWKLVATEAAH